MCVRVGAHAHTRAHVYASMYLRTNVYMLVSMISFLSHQSSPPQKLLMDTFMPTYVFTCILTCTRVHVMQVEKKIRNLKTFKKRMTKGENSQKNSGNFDLQLLHTH